MGFVKQIVAWVRRGSGLLLLACAIAFLSAQATAQSMVCHSMGTRNELPPEKLPPPQKLSGIGNVHLQIHATPEAQMWFDQGLNLFHDFWDYEAARAFEQAVRVDPNCAMCYWGIYQAEIFYHSNSSYYATQALNKAVSLRSYAGRAERLYIEAAEAHEAESKAKDNFSSKRGQSEGSGCVAKTGEAPPQGYSGTDLSGGGLGQWLRRRRRTTRWAEGSPPYPSGQLAGRPE